MCWEAANKNDLSTDYLYLLKLVVMNHELYFSQVFCPCEHIMIRIFFPITFRRRSLLLLLLLPLLADCSDNSAGARRKERKRSSLFGAFGKRRSGSQPETDAMLNEAASIQRNQRGPSPGRPSTRGVARFIRRHLPVEQTGLA